MSESRFRGIGRIIRFRRPLREHVARDVDDEIRFHLDRRTEDLVDAGLPEPEARRRALAEFGDQGRADHALRRESGRTERRLRLAELTEDFRRDLGHALRSLLKTPALTVTIVATVGLGIGATTAIFAVVHAVLVEPLPYADADRLYRIYTDSPPYQYAFSVADYQAFEEQQTRFEQVAGYANVQMIFNRGDVAERLTGKTVTWSYLPLLGVSTMLGRGFTEADGEPGAEPSVILSHRLWTRYLDGDGDAIGRTIHLDGQPHTVVGVLPRATGPLQVDREFFTVARWEPPPRRGPFFIQALGRLEAGTDPIAAEEELRIINGRIFPIWEETYQNRDATWGMRDLKEQVVGDVGSMLVLVLGAVAFVLLIASVNAANLLLARVAHRERELAVRAALGASRKRLLQHLWAESTILAFGGAGLGLFLAKMGTELIVRFGGDYVPRSQEIGLGGPVLWFLLTITLGSALLFGLIPSVQGGRARIEQALRSGGRRGTDRVATRRLRRTLVVAQFAVAAPLLVGAGLLIGSLARLQRVDPGFDPNSLLTVGISLPAAAYPEAADVLGFLEETQSRIEALPGVTAVGFSNGRPPDRYPMENNFVLVDRPVPPGATEPSVPWMSATPEYFGALGVPLIEGRVFDDLDLADDAEPVLIVDQAWAERFFPGERALGRGVLQGGCPTCTPFRIVGIVGSARYTGLDHSGGGTVYWPYWPLLGTDRSGFFFVRTSIDPLSVLPSVRAVVREMDPSLPVAGAATMEALVHGSLDTPRYLTILVTGFAAVALLLSVIGVYGVMSNFVQHHTKDIAIRIAVGGGPGSVSRAVVGRGMRLVGIGVAVGVGGALLLTRYMSSLLYEVGTTDTMTFSAVPALMLSVAVLACFLPARRAARVDPARILRED
jgi:predicted permease